MLGNLLNRRNKRNKRKVTSGNDEPKTPRWTQDETTLLRNMWKQTALPQGEFDLTYGALLHNTWDYLAHEPNEGWPETPYGDVRRTTLILVTTALRVRQSRIIPKGLPAEDAARLAELLSFVVATAVVLDQFASIVGSVDLEIPAKRSWCPFFEAPPLGAEILSRHPVQPGFGVLMLSSLMSEEGQRWLAQEPQAINALLRYFARDPRSEVLHIVETAKAIAFPRVKKSKAVEARRAQPLHQAIQNSPPEAETLPPPDTRATGRDVENEARWDNATQGRPVPAVGDKTPGKEAQEAKGWKYVLWLREAVEAGRVETNTASSFVHVLPDGAAFLAVPEAFHAYEKETGLPAKRIQNQVTRLGLHRVKKDGKNLYVAKTTEGKKRVGLVFREADSFWKVVPGPSESLTVMP